jgi:chlorobactene glucosyltransferase
MFDIASTLFFALAGIAAFMWLGVGGLGLFGSIKWPAVTRSDEPLSRRLSVTPEVVVLLPARNEARYLERTLRSVLAQDYPNFSIRMIDDGSTDATLEIARRIAGETDRLEILQGTNLPTGWAGKPWALHQLTRGRTESWFLFVDADVVLDPQALSRAMEAAEKHKADLLSFLVNIELESFWQRVVGLSFGPLMATVAPIYNINHPKKRGAFAMGGFMLLRRATYEAIGGHEGVRDRIIEDVALASRVKTRGFRLLVLPAPALVGTHYFGTFGEIWSGVRKYLYASIGFRPARLAFYTVLFGGWVFVPWIALLLGIAGFAGPATDGFWLLPWFGFAGVGCMVWMCGFIAYYTRTPLVYSLVLPLGTVFILCAVWSSAWAHHFGSGIRWKGRTLERDEVAP